MSEHFSLCNICLLSKFKINDKKSKKLEKEDLFRFICYNEITMWEHINILLSLV